jgi:hypothetical protein
MSDKSAPIPDVASRPETRYVEVRLKGAFADWYCKAKADFPAKQLAALGSGDIERIIEVLQQIVVKHNFPNGEGQLAEKIEDVDPYEGLLKAGEEIFTELGKLPNR